MKAKYYDVPYGFIHRIIDTPNENKNMGLITILCKDERVFKFKFENNFLVFRDALKIINQHTIVSNHD